MDYQVWIKDEYEDKYTKVDCGDLAAARREIDMAYKTGAEPLLTIEVPYSLAIKVEAVGTEKPTRKETIAATEKRLKEVSKSEASQSEAEPGKGTGTKS